MPSKQDNFDLFKAKLEHLIKSSHTKDEGSSSNAGQTTSDSQMLAELLSSHTETDVVSWMRKLRNDNKSIFKDYGKILLDLEGSNLRSPACSLLYSLATPLMVVDDGKPAQVSPALASFSLNYVPHLIWYYVSLPSVVSSSKDEPNGTAEQKLMIKRLQEGMEQTETCLVGLYQSASSVLPKSDNTSRVPLIQKSLYHESIYLDKPLKQIPEATVNPNLLPPVAEHYIEDSNVISFDSNIQAMSAASKPKIVEIVLRYYENFLGIKSDGKGSSDRFVSLESLLVFTLIVERLLVTGFGADTPIPYHHEIPPSVLSFLPAHIQKFYKTSSYLFSQLSESSPTALSPLSPIPNPVRFSISSSASTPNSRQLSFNDPLRPRASSQNLYSNIATPVNATNTSSSRHMLLAATLAAHQEKKSGQNQQKSKEFSLQLSHRLNLTRDTFRTILSVLYYCANFSPSKGEDSFGAQQVDEAVSSLWKSFFVQGGKHGVSTVPEDSEVETQQSSRLAPEAYHVRSSSKEEKDEGTKRRHTFAGMVDTQLKPASNEDLLHYLAFRSLKTLYHRAMYEQYWEIAMGARCLIVTLSRSGHLKGGKDASLAPKSAK